MALCPAFVCLVFISGSCYGGPVPGVSDRDIDGIIAPQRPNKDILQALKVRDPWRRHQMETFSASLAICTGNSPVTTQRPVTRSLEIFICACINGWVVNNRKAGDLRRHHAHYDVTVMSMGKLANICLGVVYHDAIDVTRNVVLQKMQWASPP